MRASRRRRRDPEKCTLGCRADVAIDETRISQTQTTVGLSATRGLFPILIRIGQQTRTSGGEK